jgi:uncharacterized protein
MTPPHTTGAGGRAADVTRSLQARNAFFASTLTPRVQQTCSGAFAFLTSEGGRPMFEGQQNEIESLMQQNAEFRALYMRHRELDKQVLDAELGVLPLDDMTLVRLKKEKLWAKDKLTHLWEQHGAHAH